MNFRLTSWIKNLINHIQLRLIGKIDINPPHKMAISMDTKMSLIFGFLSQDVIIKPLFL